MDEPSNAADSARDDGPLWRRLRRRCLEFVPVILVGIYLITVALVGIPAKDSEELPTVREIVGTLGLLSAAFSLLIAAFLQGTARLVFGLHLYLLGLLGGAHLAGSRPNLLLTLGMFALPLAWGATLARREKGALGESQNLRPRAPASRVAPWPSLAVAGGALLLLALSGKLTDPGLQMVFSAWALLIGLVALRVSGELGVWIQSVREATPLKLRPLAPLLLLGLSLSLFIYSRLA